MSNKLNKLRTRALKNPFDINSHHFHINSSLLEFMGKTNSINTRIEEQYPKKFKIDKIETKFNRKKR